MNKRFIRVFLFGALAFASASTFVGCTDYDDDIKNLQQQIDTNKDAIAKLQELVGAGKWVTKVESIEGGIKVTMNDGTTTEIKSIGKDGINGVDGKDGKDGSIVEIKDGYWYINGENQNIKAEGKDGINGTDGKDGVDGEDGKDGTNGTDGKDGINGEDGKDGINGTDGKDGINGTNGVDGHDVKVGSTGKLQVWDAETSQYVDTKFEAAGAYVVANGNYWNLHVLNQSTGEYETIKLPATEIQGVTGITVMDAAALAFKYDAMTSANKDAATIAKWAGLKGIPAADEVLFADMKPIIVQVTPYNFDLTTAKPQIVNSLGEEAPFTIDVKPYVSDQPLTRAASANGLWEITLTGVKDGVDAAAFAKALKVGGSEVKFALKSGDFLGTYGDVAFNGTGSVGAGTPAGNGDVLYNGAAITSDVPTGKEVTLTLGGSSAGVYDSYLTVNAASADAAKEYGIEPKGMSFTANEKAAGQTVTFTLHQMSVNGTIDVSSNNVAVTFATGKVTPDAPIVIDYVVSEAKDGAEVNFGTALTSISETTAGTLESIEWTFTKEDGSALDASTDVPFKAPTTPASDYLDKSESAADLSSGGNIQSNIRSVVKTTLPVNNYTDNAKPGVYMANFILKDAKGNQVKVVPVKINVTLPAADDLVAKKAANFVDNTLIARLVGASTTGSLTYAISNIYTLKNGAVATNFVMDDLTETGATYAQPNLTAAAGKFWSEEKGYIPAKVQFTYKVAGNSNFAVEIPAIDAKFVSPFYGAALLVQDKVEVTSGTPLVLEEYNGALDPKTGIALSVKGLSTAIVKLMTTSSGSTKPDFVKDFTIENGAYVSGTIDDNGLTLTASPVENEVADKIIISVTDYNDVVTKFTLDVTVK